MFLARMLRVLFLAGALVCCVVAHAQGPGAARESAVKAAFLSKFPGFVDWPAGVLSQAEEPLVIGVIGNDEVAADLQQIAAARPRELRPIVVRKLADASQSPGIHLLFIGTGRDARVRDIASQVRGPVLVVTEQEEGLRLGGALNFSVEHGKVRFAAAPATAEARGLRLSARLLALAQSVEGRAP